MTRTPTAAAMAYGSTETVSGAPGEDLEGEVPGVHDAAPVASASTARRSACRRVRNMLSTASPAAALA